MAAGMLLPSFCTDLKSWGPIIVLVLSCTVGSAIHEDEAGIWDWHQQYCGKVTHAVFQTTGPKKRVFVATEQNALAALNLRTGQIGWRHVLPSGDSVDKLLTTGRSLVTLSGSGKVVRAWNVQDGSSLWEAHVFSSSAGGAAARGEGVSDLVLLDVDLDGDSVPDLVALAGIHVAALSRASGAVIWKTQLDLPFTSQAIHFSSSANTLTLAGLPPVSIPHTSLHVATLSASSGALIGTPTTLTAPVSLRTDLLLITGAHSTVVAVSATGQELITFSVVGQSSAAVNSWAITDLVPAAGTSLLHAGGGAHVRLLPSALDSAVAVSFSGGVAVLAIGSEGRPEMVTVSAGVLAGIVTNAVEVEGLSVVFGTVATTSDSLQLNVLGGQRKGPGDEDGVAGEGAGGGALLEETVPWDTAAHGTVERAFLNPYVRKDGGHGFRVVVVGTDGSLALLQQGEVVWAREEALGGVTGAVMVDLPVGLEESVVANVEEGVVEWLKEHLLAAKVTLMLATEAEKADLSHLRKSSPLKLKAIRDHNGFRQQIVTLTSSGKLFSLHSGDGRILWSARTPVLRPQRLLMWRVPHDRRSAPEIAVLGKGAGETGLVAWVDGYRGSVVRTEELPFIVAQVIVLPLHTSDDHPVLLLIDPANTAHVFPSTDEAISLVRSKQRSIFRFVVDKERGTITGYGVEVVAGAGVSSVELWQVVFPRGREEIAAVERPREDEAIHSGGKVLGDRSVLYKYLNRNTVFVATTTPQLAGQAADDLLLTAYLVDSVTGKIIYRVTHPGMKGPVHAVMSENWVVYHYLNARATRYEVSVLELLDESRLREDAGQSAVQQVLGAVLGLQPGNESVSSLAPPAVKVLGQSYFFPTGVKALAVTVTAKGIASKMILFGTTAGQILALDRRFFDPRRPLTPTPIDSEEGLIAYSEAIPYIPTAFLTHSLQVEGVRGIVTAPARLESATLIFAYGVDLFFIRFHPSKMFDLLSEDFNYALLLATIVALLVGIVIFYFWSKKTALQNRWK